MGYVFVIGLAGLAVLCGLVAIAYLLYAAFWAACYALAALYLLYFHLFTWLLSGKSVARNKVPFRFWVPLYRNQNNTPTIGSIHYLLRYFPIRSIGHQPQATGHNNVIIFCYSVLHRIACVCVFSLNSTSYYSYQLANPPPATCATAATRLWRIANP